MNRITVTILCLMLCLAGIAVPTASAASRLTTSSRTALASSLQQEYLMRDTYQYISAKYPALTTFGAVAADENSTIATLKSLFAKYRISAPSDTQVSAAKTIAATATSISGADGIALNLEQSTATLMIRLLPSADNQDVASALTLIKTASLSSHTTAFATEQARVSTAPAPLPPSTPILSSPSDGSIVGSLTPTLSWSVATGASSYAVQVSLSTAFGTTIVNQSTTGTSLITSSLTNATQYYWRTNATSAAGTSAWSSPRTFTTPASAPVSTQRIVSFTTSSTRSTLLGLLADETVDVIEMAAGTYNLPVTYIDINRTRPVVVRPAAGATVVLSGVNLGGSGQFEIGDHGTAGNITMQGLIFDGYTLGQIGIFHIFNAHDITLNDMVVRNSRANGTSAAPYHSWAVYITSTSTVSPTNIAVNRWTVDGSARGLSALQVYGGSHITATGWTVAHAYFAVYACSDRGPLTDFILDGWTVTDTGSSSTSLYFNTASGRYSNMHATGSGVLVNLGTPKLTDGGSNSL